MIPKEERQDDGWIDREIAACESADARLGKRFRSLLERIGDAVGESIPMACQDWAETKAAYRFFANERVDEGDILAGHFQATRDRFAASEGTVLVLHDTTEFSFQRQDPRQIGITYNVNSGRDKEGRIRAHTVCGILMHSSPAVTTAGLPLGLAAIKFWNRNKVQGHGSAQEEGEPDTRSY